MAYDEVFVNRIREELRNEIAVEEKKMFQGVCFMVNDKMCVCVRDDDMLCRIGAEQAAIELEKDQCRQMVSQGRVMKNFVFVPNENVRTTQALKYWIDLALRFNVEAKASGRRQKKQE
jgi:TfoX/Sxy family transcriptional regulator of competence genes